MTLSFLLIQISHMTTFQSSRRRCGKMKVDKQQGSYPAVETLVSNQVFKKGTVECLKPSCLICSRQPPQNVALAAFPLFGLSPPVCSGRRARIEERGHFAKVCSHPTSQRCVEWKGGCRNSAPRPPKAHARLEAPLKHVTVRNVNALLTFRKSLRWHMHVSVEIC